MNNNNSSSYNIPDWVDIMTGGRNNTTLIKHQQHEHITEFNTLEVCRRMCVGI